MLCQAGRNLHPFPHARILGEHGSSDKGGAFRVEHSRPAVLLVPKILTTSIPEILATPA